MTYQLLARMLYSIHLCSTAEPSLMALESELVIVSVKVRLKLRELEDFLFLSMPVSLIKKIHLSFIH